MRVNRFIGLSVMLAACGACGTDAADETHPDDAVQPIDVSPPPTDSARVDGPPRIEDAVPACPTESPPACVSALLSWTATTATVGWRICCTAPEVLSIVQVGVAPGLGDADSTVAACGAAQTLTLALNRPGTPWASVDTLEFPYTMDSPPFQFCDTPGAPPR